MKKLLYPSFLLAASLAGCRHDSDPTCAATLAGTWRLTNLQCYCSPAPLKNEIITFDGNEHFQVFRDGQLSAEGTYSLSRSPSCGQATVRDQLSLRLAAPNTYAPGGAYSLKDCTLIIDQTNGCISDGPTYTYTRQP